LLERRDILERELGVVRSQHAERTGFWNYFARRRLVSEQSALEVAGASVAEQIERYERARHDKLKEVPTLPEEIGIDGKRLVNLSVLALAQELCLAFGEQDVATLARESSLRQVTEARYGSLQDCRNLSQQIERVLRKVSYRRDADTVPAPDALAIIPALTAPTDQTRSAQEKDLPVNVLAEEYWDIYAVLLT
jgi:hypothetical protein